MEPEQLRRGKEFHRVVQAAWSGRVAGTPARAENPLCLAAFPRENGKLRKGRVDIFIDKIDDFVTVVEIKATDWDRVRPAGRRKLLSSHRRQILGYIDTYLVREKINVPASSTPGSRALRA